jgi:hypothetical protein
MVERYKMTAPITIRFVDNMARFVRASRANRDQAGAWQLMGEPTAVPPPLGGEIEFPLTMNAQDAKGNIVKMELQLEMAKPEFVQKKNGSAT